MEKGPPQGSRTVSLPGLDTGHLRRWGVGTPGGNTGSVLRKESKAKAKHDGKVVRLVVWEGDHHDLVTSGKCGCLWDIQVFLPAGGEMPLSSG